VEPGGLVDGGQPVVGLGHDLDVGLGAEQHRQTRADQRLVVREQHLDHCGTSRWAATGAAATGSTAGSVAESR
jgi:hypothetical protein